MIRSGSQGAVLAILVALLATNTDAFLPHQRHGLTAPSRANDAAKLSFLKATSEDETPPPPPADEVKDKKKGVKAIILEAFPEAADPMYAVRGPVGEGDFVVSREGGPTAEELGNKNILRIVLSESTDLEVNTLVWKGLGYRFDAEKEEWNASKCFPKWKEKYATPPDFIGMRREYSREIDVISLRSNQALVKSVPVDNKQSLKEQMKPLGWKGFQYKELTPNLTRRAQCANWLVFFREELFGYTLEELRERRTRKKEAEELAQQIEGREDEWSPPIREVY